MKYVLGVDIGTTSVKISALSERCELIFEKQISHDLISIKPNFAEEDPKIWWKNTEKLIKEAVDELGGELVAIGVSGMVPTLILVDEDGEPIRLSIQQNDARSISEIEYFKSRIDEEEFFQKTGNTINQQLIFPKFEWLRKNEPNNVSRARWIMGSYNYITYKLTGKPTLDSNWALESGMWDLKRKCWLREILDLAKIDPNMLPPVYESWQVIGFLNRKIAEEFGLKKDVLVIAGSADHIASTLAVGALEAKDLVLKIGGAGDVMYVTDDLKTDKRLFIDYHDVPGKYVLNGCMASSGSIVKWFSKDVVKETLENLNKTAKTSKIGSNGLIVLPYFLGEKTPIFDPKAKGVIVGLSLSHNVGDLFRSIMEAVAYGFYHHIEVIRQMGQDVKRVFLCNGGAKSELWRQIVADVTGYDLIYIEGNIDSSVGVAFLAGYSASMFSSWKDVERISAKRVIVKSDPTRHEFYMKYYELYRKTYEALKQIMAELHDLAEMVNNAL